MYSLEVFDEAKTKVLKYILYKKRTENQVKVKFSRVMQEDLLNDVIDYLKERKNELRILYNVGYCRFLGLYVAVPER